MLSSLYGFVVMAWLIFPNDQPATPFSSRAACEDARTYFTARLRPDWHPICASTGAASK